MTTTPSHPMEQTTPLLVASPLFYGDDVMLCPSCAEPYVHIDEVVFSYRQEDKTPHKATFDAVDGVLRLHGAAPEEYSSRRQWVGLVINCECCDGGMLVFAQHKGVTHVIEVPTKGERS